jgi:hypothetical protein
VNKNFVFCFDVESMGLTGEGFAVGGGLWRPDGSLVEDFLYCCPRDKLAASQEDHVWLDVNTPKMAITHDTPRGVRDAFWKQYRHACISQIGYAGPMVVVDCGWPVEARFLLDCLRDDHQRVGPYPLHELATLLRAAGQDPLGTYGRLPGELPKHNPLCDARQTARLWFETKAYVDGMVNADKDM